MPNAVNQNFPTELAQTADIIKDVLSFQLRRVKLLHFMKIALDVFGGDNAPLSNIKGAFAYLENCNDSAAELILVGDEGQIKTHLDSLSLDSSKVSIVHTIDTV